jgi:hypothetical protein
MRVKVTALPITMKRGRNLCPKDPANIGGRIGRIHGVRADKNPERNTINIEGWANIAVTPETMTHHNLTLL